MTTEQSLKAAARRSAQAGPKADPETAAQALDDAKSVRDSQRPAQKLSATLLDDEVGENNHHDKDQVISEFDDPTAHKVR
jgi:hypothetical protein